MPKENIYEIIDKNSKRVVDIRRHIHQNPELSFEEFDTADYIAKNLEGLGLRVERNVGGTGIVATLETGRKGKTIAFRADMDALSIIEETGLPFSSKKTGIMHACGHDAHVSILLGLAFLLSEIKSQLCGTIIFVFQPGEEANGGALGVINDEAFKNKEVEAVFALHMMPDLPTGTIGIKPGYLSATDDEFTIKVKGSAAHSSEPEIGVNAIIIASQIVNNIMTILGSNISPYDIATMSVCKISGGEAVNIIPEWAELGGMIRCVEKKNKMIIREKMETMAINTAKAMGGSVEVEFISGFPSVNNDENLTKTVIHAAEKTLKAKEDILHIEKPHLGSEDFAYFQEVVPGVMFMLGCENPGVDAGALHTSILNIDEEAMKYGVGILGEIALDLCGKQKNKIWNGKGLGEN